jgi:hypothetical protein
MPTPIAGRGESSRRGSRRACRTSRRVR